MHEESELRTPNWTPLFASLLDSSVWTQESKETRLVWICLLAKKNRNGFVDVSLPGLAKLAGVTIDECESAVKVLEGPDKYSRNHKDDGRRIRPVENGGWQVLNHGYYRSQLQSAERREYLRRKQAEYRARKEASESSFTEPPH